LITFAVGTLALDGRFVQAPQRRAAVQIEGVQAAVGVVAFKSLGQK